MDSCEIAVFGLEKSDYMATRRHIGKPDTGTVALLACVSQGLNFLFGINFVSEEVVRCPCIAVSMGSFWKKNVC